MQWCYFSVWPDVSFFIFCSLFTVIYHQNHVAARLFFCVVRIFWMNDHLNTKKQCFCMYFFISSFYLVDKLAIAASQQLHLNVSIYRFIYILNNWLNEKTSSHTYWFYKSNERKFWCLVILSTGFITFCSILDTK